MTDSKSSDNSTKNGKKTNKKRSFLVAACLWVVLAFGIPYWLTFQSASNPYIRGEATRAEKAKRTLDNANREAIRAGIMGALVAIIILSIWKLDRFAFAKTEKDMDKVQVKAVICILGCFLWIIWTSSAYIMVRAYDEITDTGTNIPGFQMD